MNRARTTTRPTTSQIRRGGADLATASRSLPAAAGLRHDGHTFLAALLVITMTTVAPDTGWWRQGQAVAQSYDLSVHTIGGGGGTSTSGAVTLSGTIGQPAAGTALTGGTFELNGGFWPVAATAPAAAVTIVSANPPMDNPFIAGTQPFRDVLQTGTTPVLTQGIGMAVTPNQDTVVYSTITVTFSGTPSLAPSTSNITVTCNGSGPYLCPSVTSVAGSGAGPYGIALSGPIPPRNCTTLTFAGTTAGQKVQYQYLPGDMNFSGSVSASDINVLVIAINNGQAALAANLPRYNVNRVGTVSATDLARLVQLLNGVNTTQVWTGATAAACP